MNKRPTNDLSTSSGESSNASPPRKRKARQRQRKAREPPLPLYRATVDEVADSSNVATGAKAADPADNSILQRIKKCLERGNHPDTAEAEAKAALHLASRLMGQHNVSRAEALAHEDPSARQQYAGQSIVSLQRTDGGWKGVRHQGYLDDLCFAMRCFFNCKHYTTSYAFHLSVTFYGIAENTTAAAMSFEMVYNLVNEWARTYKGGSPRNSYLLGIGISLESMALKEKAKEEADASKAEADAIAARERAEQAEQQARMDRLASLPRSPSAEPQKLGIDRNASVISIAESSHSTLMSSENESYLSESESYRGFDFDDDDSPADEGSDADDCIETDFKVELKDYVNPLIDVDEEVQRLVKLEPEKSGGPSRLWSVPLAASGPHEEKSSQGGSPTTRPAATEDTAIEAEEQEPHNEPQWASHMQLVKFRETAADIADDFIKERGMKLRAGRAKQRCIQDMKSYSEGKADSRKIDVRRRRITE